MGGPPDEAGVGRRTDPAPARVLTQSEGEQSQPRVRQLADAPHDADGEASDRVESEGCKEHDLAPLLRPDLGGHEEEDTIYEHGARLERQRRLPAHRDTDRAEDEVDLQRADGPPGDEAGEQAGRSPSSHPRQRGVDVVPRPGPRGRQEPAELDPPQRIARRRPEAPVHRPDERHRGREGTGPREHSHDDRPRRPEPPARHGLVGDDDRNAQQEKDGLRHRLADLRRAHGRPSEARSDVRPQEPDPEKLTTDRRRRREVVDGVAGQTSPEQPRRADRTLAGAGRPSPSRRCSSARSDSPPSGGRRGSIPWSGDPRRGSGRRSSRP